MSGSKAAWWAFCGLCSGLLVILYSVLAPLLLVTTNPLVPSGPFGWRITVLQTGKKEYIISMGRPLVYVQTDAVRV